MGRMVSLTLLLPLGTDMDKSKSIFSQAFRLKGLQKGNKGIWKLYRKKWKVEACRHLPSLKINILLSTCPYCES
jgi:hypothetical protein